jgi:hypothetical protein
MTNLASKLADSKETGDGRLEIGEYTAKTTGERKTSYGIIWADDVVNLSPREDGGAAQLVGQSDECAGAGRHRRTDSAPRGYRTRRFAVLRFCRAMRPANTTAGAT